VKFSSHVFGIQTLLDVFKFYFDQWLTERGV
jgi:hypothetical protein